MTIAAVRSQARRYSRVDSTAASNAEVNDLIQDAVTEFSNDVGGFNLEVYPAISASFDTSTNYAMRITIVGGSNPMVATDVVITSTARSGATGTVVASDLQTALQAATGGSETVTWANFAFTIDTLDATSITFEAPTTATYVDARELLGITGTPDLTDFSFTGSFPYNSTIEYTLPSDMISVQQVEWNTYKLHEVSQQDAMSPLVQGVPYWYHIRGRVLHFIPSPQTQGNAKVWYRGAPPDIVFSGYQEAGLSGVSDELQTGLSTTTQYYYKVTINGQQTEYNITTAADTTYAAVIVLMNAQNTGATFSIVGGDLRCTSDAVDGVSTIALAAGTTGTDLFATLTGWSAFDTAVAGDTDMPDEIPAMYHKAVPFLVAYYLLLEQFDEEKLGAQRYGQYAKTMRQFRLSRLSRSTVPGDNDSSRWGLRYTVDN